MVSFSTIQASNRRILSELPAGLVAVFAGATAGIGEISLKTFAKYTKGPRAYFIGRSREAAERIMSECQAINLTGQYTFLAADLSLVKGMDEVCKEIKAKEKTINLLFLSAGIPSMDRTPTSEGLFQLAALNYYCRIRMISNLLPLIQASQSLKRIVYVGGGGYEGKLDTNDFQGLNVEMADLRPHLTALVTLGLQTVAKQASDVSIVHNYPGTVPTRFLDAVPEEMLEHLTIMPLHECGERQVYLATSATYPAATKSDANKGVQAESGANVIIGVDGKPGSGLYSVGSDCESASSEVRAHLAEMRQQGLIDQVWQHTQAEFQHITA
ncbi:hypothetical protein F5Y16DRAFT_406787 [Xylariaceae sp. FL0255]|nr:hypothetical protein F5Y16DRAFT_406787 [Xylariaceae sp. FL0255]